MVWVSAFYKQGTPGGVIGKSLIRNENSFARLTNLFQSKFKIRKSRIPTLPANSTVMKKSVVIGIGVGGVLLIGVFAIVFVPPRKPLSLSFLEYQPLRAKLKLTNNSSKTITYLTDYAGGAVLVLAKTSPAWTNSSRELLNGTGTDGLTGKARPIYIYADPGFMTNGPPDNFKILHPNDLKPGQSVELYAWLQADGSPIRVGTVCIVPQGKLAQQFGRWLNRVKRWCRMKPTVPGRVEVWCNEQLQVPLSPTRGTNHYDL
jgi:hypothetical protein